MLTSLHPSVWTPSQNHGARCSLSSLEAVAVSRGGQRVCRRGGGLAEAHGAPTIPGSPTADTGTHEGPTSLPTEEEEKRNGTEFPKHSEQQRDLGLCEDVSQDQAGEGQPQPHLSSPRTTPTAAVGPGSQLGGR